MEAARPGRPQGLATLLWRLSTASAFEPMAPTHVGEPYRDSPAGGGVAPLADVYLPTVTTESAAVPSVVIVHGGGFLIGSRRMKPVLFLATRLAEAGFVVATFDYRLIFRGGRLDESLEDVAAMLAWWRGSCASRFALDVERISLLGLSAGATLTSLHASVDPGLHRVVSCFGLQDFSWMGGPGARLVRRLLLRSGDPAAWKARSPVERCMTETPVMLLHGEADGFVDPEHSRRLAAAREARGLPTRLALYEGAPHGFFMESDQPAALQATDDIITFLRS